VQKCRFCHAKSKKKRHCVNVPPLIGSNCGVAAGELSTFARVRAIVWEGTTAGLSKSCR
jgi:hypothetical protein